MVMFLRKLNKNGKHEDIPLKKNLFLGKDAAAEIHVKDGQAYIMCYHNVELYGDTCFGKRKLTHDAMIELDGERYLFKNPESTEKVEKCTIKVTRISQIPKKPGLKILKESAYKMYMEFMTEVLPSKKNFVEKICVFVQNTFNFDRIIFYKVRINRSWVPLWAIAPEQHYRPSNKVLFQVYKSKEPVLIEVKGRPQKDLSCSIIENRIVDVIGCPLYNLEGEFCAVLYADKSEKEIPLDYLYILTYFCIDISIILDKYL